MKLSKISLATAAVCGVMSAPALAIDASQYDNTVVNVYVTGATALDAGLLEATLKICQAGTLTRYAASNQFVYFCTADGATSGLTAGTKLAVYKHSVGGSGNGVQPVNSGAALPFLKLSDGAAFGAQFPATAVATSAGGFTYSNALISTAGSTSPVSNVAIGISDLEPAFFENDVVVDLPNLTSEPLASVIFGVPVTRNVYEALQAAQGLTVGSLTEANLPTLNTPQLTTVYTQVGKTWNAVTRGAITIPGTVAQGAGRVFVARRVDTSGTQKTFEALFARTPNGLIGKSINNGSDGLTPDLFVSGPEAADNTAANTLANATLPIAGTPPANLVINNSGGGNVVFTLNRFQAQGKGGVGILATDAIISTSGNTAAAADNIRFVKINGVAPTVANVINGSYPYYADASLNTNAANLVGNQLTFYTALKQQFAIFPAVQVWGNTGAVPLNEVTGLTTGNPWSRTTNGAVNNGQQSRLAP